LFQGVLGFNHVKNVEKKPKKTWPLTDRSSQVQYINKIVEAGLIWAPWNGATGATGATGDDMA